MSVQTQIDRLNAVKDRIRTNLVAQGITVPADTMLEEMAEQILSVAGKDGTSATHSWNGTVLTITSASGTSSADLKGDKGDKGIPGVAQYPAFAETVEGCTDTSKVYVLPNGYIYGYLEGAGGPPEFVISDNPNGYWKANAVWYSTSGYCAKSTDMVEVTPGDQIEYTGLGAYGAISVCWYKADKSVLSSEAINKSGWSQDTRIVTAPENAAYVRFFSYKQTETCDGVTLIVTWVLCQKGSSAQGWTNTGHAFVPAEYEDRIISLENSVRSMNAAVPDPLTGKKIIYDGDSICQSDDDSGGAYAGIIASIVKGRYSNHAVGGARLCANSDIHSVVNNLSNLPMDGDLYCFQGGINDWWANTPVGTFTQGDYTGTVDPTTIYGAMETIFRYALTNFVGKPICFVITHKVQNSAYSKNTAGNTFSDYRKAMIDVCEKYSIPYYDAFARSGLNGWNTAQNNTYLTGNSAGTADGVHPNADGYKRYYVPQLLNLFREIMPVN